MPPLSEGDVKRIAEAFQLGDEGFLQFMRDMLALVPVKDRAIIYTEPWVRGFVTGLVYSKVRRDNVGPRAVSVDVLLRLVSATLEALSNTPHVSRN